LVVSRRKLGSKDFEWGLVKGYFCKPKLSKEAAALYSIVLQMHAEANMTDRGIASDLCKVYDLYSDESHTAPKAQINRRKQLKAAAVEIVDRWNVVAERLEIKSETHERRHSTKKGA
jgi:hypothetical protein